MLTHGERAPIAVPTSPPCVVAGGDAYVRVAELAAHIAELHPRREQLGRERVSQVLRRPGAGRSVRLDRRPDAGRLAELPKVAVAIVAVIHRSDRTVCRQAFSDRGFVLLRESSFSRLRLGRVA